MGSANGDEALISAVAAGGLAGSSTKSLKLLNARTLQPIWELTAGPGPMGFMGGMGDRGMQYRSDRFLSKISGWATSISPTGDSLLVSRDRDFEQLYEHSSEGYLAMGDDGNIYTESGRVLTDDPNRNERAVLNSCRCLHSPDWCLVVQSPMASPSPVWEVSFCLFLTTTTSSSYSRRRREV